LQSQVPAPFTGDLATQRGLDHDPLAAPSPEGHAVVVRKLRCQRGQAFPDGLLKQLTNTVLGTALKATNAPKFIRWVQRRSPLNALTECDGQADWRQAERTHS
jgi:hypothetical protein